MSQEIIIKMLSEKQTLARLEFNFITNDDINAFYSSSSIENNRFRTAYNQNILWRLASRKTFNIDAFYN